MYLKKSVHQVGYLTGIDIVNCMVTS
jgi:hypothetical protein